MRSTSKGWPTGGRRCARPAKPPRSDHPRAPDSAPAPTTPGRLRASRPFPESRRCPEHHPAPTNPFEGVVHRLHKVNYFPKSQAKLSAEERDEYQAVEVTEHLEGD